MIERTICASYTFVFLLQELCGKGGILLLAQSILKLHIQPCTPNRITAAISRLKAKILSIVSQMENFTINPCFYL